MSLAMNPIWIETREKTGWTRLITEDFVEEGEFDLGSRRQRISIRREKEGHSKEK